MRIDVKANFVIAGVDCASVEVEENATLGDVLTVLGNRTGIPFIGPDRKIDPQMEVLLNGLEYAFHPKRLGTPLAENDKVEILILAMAGG